MLPSDVSMGSEPLVEQRVRMRSNGNRDADVLGHYRTPQDSRINFRLALARP